MLRAEPESASRATALRLEVVDHDGAVALSGRWNLGEGDGEVTLPAIVPLAPRDADPGRGWSLTAELLDGDGAFSLQRAIGGYLEGTRSEVALLFDDRCIGQLDCLDRQTCHDGRCVSACIAVEDGTASNRQPSVSCPGPSCSDADPPRCDGEKLVRCLNGEQRATACPLGCSAGRCRSVAPSNLGGAVAIDAGTADLTVAAGETWVFDTDSGTVDVYTAALDQPPARRIRPGGAGEEPSFAVVPVVDAANPNLGVFGFERFEIAEGGRVIGVGTRPLVLLAAREVIVDGRLTVAADQLPIERPGAGGFRGGLQDGEAGRGPGGGGAGVEGKPTYNDAGGGGASYGGTGGKGGDGWTSTTSTVVGLGGSAGKIYGEATLVPLLGGSGGGPGSGASKGFGRGGHGGGALQISAGERIVISVTGAIDASGGGGHSGDGKGGGGAGSGGAVLLEAPEVVAKGPIGANGGSGGQGGYSSAPGSDGVSGRPDHVPAPGTSTIGSRGGGGDGSDVTGNAEGGDIAQNGGGAGGGAGRIRINTLSGSERFEAGLLPPQSSSLATVGKLGLQ